MSKQFTQAEIYQLFLKSMEDELGPRQADYTPQAWQGMLNRMWREAGEMVQRQEKWKQQQEQDAE